MSSADFVNGLLCPEVFSRGGMIAAAGREITKAGLFDPAGVLHGRVSGAGADARTRTMVKPVAEDLATTSSSSPTGAPITWSSPARPRTYVPSRGSEAQVPDKARFIVNSTGHCGSS